MDLPSTLDPIQDLEEGIVKEWISADELADRLGVTKRTLRARADREEWEGDLRQGPDGRVRRYYRIDEEALPDEPPQERSAVPRLRLASAADLLEEARAIRRLLERVVDLLEQRPEKTVTEAAPQPHDSPPDPDKDPDVWNGELLRRWRTERNLSQRELARRIGVGRSAISHFEASRREPGDEALEELRRLGFPG